MKKIRITESQLKSIVKNLIKEESSKLMEMGRDDIYLRAILAKYDEPSDAIKKTIAREVLGGFDRINFNPAMTRVKIYKALRYMDYQDVSSITRKLGIRV